MNLGLVEIVGVVALLSASALCMVAISAILKLSKNIERVTFAVENVQADVRAMRMAALPALEQATKVLEQANTTLARVDADLQKISAGADTFKSIADDVRGLEQIVFTTIKPSLEELAEFISSVVGTLTSVTRRFSKFLS